MRFKQYLTEEEFNILGCYMMIDSLDESVSDETFIKLQTLGQKFGVKVRRSKTFQSVIKKTSIGVLHLMKLVLDYSIHADIMDRDVRLKLESNIKAQFSKVKQEDVISFIVNIDKTFLGITSIPRHVMQNILGITITTYDNWVSNQEYVLKTLEKVMSVLDNMGDKDNLDIIKRVYLSVKGDQ